jgi:galactokinase
METKTFKQHLSSPAFQNELEKLYGKQQVPSQTERYLTIYQRFLDRFPNVSTFDIFSSSGRIEVGGNHTDHQLGRVLAMSVDLDTVAFACRNDQNVIHFVSKDYQIEPISCEDLSVHPEEYFTTMGLIRGLAFNFKEIHGSVGGFDAYVESSVMSGSGLSSSASVEVLIAKILDTYYGSNKMSVSDYAIIAQKAENNYFNKPCGLMDQMVIAHGGFCAIDFYDKSNPVVTKVDAHGMFDSMDICLVQSGGSHADLSGDYAEIFHDCKEISNYFNQEVLSRVNEENFNRELRTLYTRFDTRALLRAHHFFQENKRVLKLMDDLKQGNLPSFIQHIIDSGLSSMNYLQNTWNKHSHKQGLALALMMAEDQLKGKGAYRVHGGGFAGTILLFIPKQDTESIKMSYEAVFGKECFIQIRLREVGVIQVH